MRGEHGAVAENAGEFLILIAFGNGALMSQRFLGALQLFQGRIVVRLVLGRFPVGLGFL